MKAVRQTFIPIQPRGFASWIVLVLLLVIAAVGFAAWKVSLRQAMTEIPQTQPSAPQTPSPVSDATHTVFTSTKLGVRFAYPKSWGEASVTPGPETAHLTKGSEYTIVFSANPKVTAGLQSKDWTHNPNMGHDGTIYAGQYAHETYANLVKEEGEQYGFSAVTYSRTPHSFIIGAGLGGIACEAVAELYVQALPDNAVYGGIAFMYQEKVADTASVDKESGVKPEDICADGTYQKLLSKDHVEELRAIELTIKSL